MSKVSKRDVNAIAPSKEKGKKEASAEINKNSLIKEGKNKKASKN